MIILGEYSMMACIIARAIPTRGFRENGLNTR
jgi:hypothetical protein